MSFCRNSISEQEKVKKTVLDEINLLYRLRHPHIVQCLGATQHLGHFNIFMEIMPGIIHFFKSLIYCSFASVEAQSGKDMRIAVSL